VINDRQRSDLLGRIAAAEDILGNAAVHDRSLFLLHHRDAAQQRVMRGLYVNFLPVEDDRAFVSLVDAEQALHQRGLAGAVLTHQSMHGSRLHVQLDMIQRLDAREALTYIFHLKNILFTHGSSP